MPTQHGETAVIRLLPRDRGLLDIAKLGFAPTTSVRSGRLLDLPHGMIVITGPTGSGKTTTLATMLSRAQHAVAQNTDHRGSGRIRDRRHQSVSGQARDRPHLRFGFARLRSQDPDVIMVGEIRDAETANIAIHAALTGHLVLTTLHTETAIAAMPRLLDLGVEGFPAEIDAAGRHRTAAGPRLVRSVQVAEGNLRTQISTRDPRYEALWAFGRRDDF